MSSLLQATNTNAAGTKEWRVASRHMLISAYIVDVPQDTTSIGDLAPKVDTSATKGLPRNTAEPG